MSFQGVYNISVRYRESERSNEMAKKYYKGWVTLPMERHVPACTEKAFALTYAGGTTTFNDDHVWFPKSQVIIGEPNEVGNADILIPVWLFKAKGIDARRIREIALDEIVER